MDTDTTDSLYSVGDTNWPAMVRSMIVHGDAVSYSIAAASIIAKVTRDRMIVELDKEYPIQHFPFHRTLSTGGSLLQKGEGLLTLPQRF